MGCSGCGCTSVTLSPEMQELYKALGFNDKNADGIIEEQWIFGAWRNEGYDYRADLNEDKKITEVEAKYCLHRYFDSCSCEIDYAKIETLRKKLPLTWQDKQALLVIVKEKIGAIQKIPSEQLQSSEDGNVKARMLSEKVYVLIKLKLYKEALTATDDIKNAYYRSGCYLGMAGQMLDDGQYEAANDLIKAHRLTGEDMIKYKAHYAYCLAKEGKFDEAEEMILKQKRPRPIQISPEIAALKAKSDRGLGLTREEVVKVVTAEGDDFDLITNWHVQVTLPDIAIFEAKAGQFKRSIALTRNINDLSIRSSALKAIAPEMKKAGQDTDRVLAVFKDAAVSMRNDNDINFGQKIKYLADIAIEMTKSEIPKSETVYIFEWAISDAASAVDEKLEFKIDALKGVIEGMTKVGFSDPEIRGLFKKLNVQYPN